jgi:hypothetical protein
LNGLPTGKITNDYGHELLLATIGVPIIVMGEGSFIKWTIMQIFTYILEYMFGANDD